VLKEMTMSRTCRAIAVAAIAALPTLAAAQTATIPSEHLAAVDADSDGAVTLAEMQARMGEAFVALDADGDGFISWPEAQVTMDRALFDGADANGDRGLSRAEFDAQVAADFAAADQDGNGVLD